MLINEEILNQPSPSDYIEQQINIAQPPEIQRRFQYDLLLVQAQEMEHKLLVERDLANREIDALMNHYVALRQQYLRPATSTSHYKRKYRRLKAKYRILQQRSKIRERALLEASSSDKRKQVDDASQGSRDSGIQALGSIASQVLSSQQLPDLHTFDSPSPVASNSIRLKSPFRSPVRAANTGERNQTPGYHGGGNSQDTEPDEPYYDEEADPCLEIRNTSLTLQPRVLDFSSPIAPHKSKFPNEVLLPSPQSPIPDSKTKDQTAG